MMLIRRQTNWLVPCSAPARPVRAKMRSTREEHLFPVYPQHQTFDTCGQFNARQLDRKSLVPNLLNYFEFSHGYGEADSWFESYSLRHELSI
jgi:hypothetical protein